MSKGWIKIDRGIMDHWIFQDAEYFRAWVLILLMANHEETTILINKTPAKIPRGAFHSSIAILAEKFGWTKNRTLRYLGILERDTMLTTKRTANGTTFFVENYGKYQDARYTDETADRTADETADRTADRTAGDTQTRIYKNDKNEKKVRNARARDPHAGEDLDSVANLIKELSDAKGHI